MTNPKKPSGVSIFVDYAHEPASMQKLLDTVRYWKSLGYYDFVIHILSCDGAGRDDWKKPVMGQISFLDADFSFFTTDNYTEKDNPDDILKLLSKNVNPRYSFDSLKLDSPDQQNFDNQSQKQREEKMGEIQTIETQIEKAQELKIFEQQLNSYLKKKPFKKTQKTEDNLIEEVPKFYVAEKNRFLAFQKSIILAKKIDELLPNSKILIFSTGVGSEKGLTQPGGVINWNEKESWQTAWNSTV